MSKWMTSWWRLWFWSIIATSELNAYMVNQAGVLGTVWEHLAVAAIALQAMWDCLRLREEVRQ